MSQIILMAGIIIIICLCFGKISGKIGVPSLLVFILLGMIFGSDGIFKIDFDNYFFAEKICSVSLIFIMFYGGFGTNWKKAKPIAVKSVLLSTLGVVLTAVTVGLFCRYALRFDLLESMLIGSVISSTDAASVFSILRSKRLNLKYSSASLLEMESGSNDPFSYMLTMVILSVMSGKSDVNIFNTLFAQIVYGVIFGSLTAIVSSFVLSKHKITPESFGTLFVFAAALISYAGASLIGGNGYLSVYITGIILGNRPIYNKKSLVHFFDGFTELMQILIFFLLGLLSSPSQMPKIFIPAFAIAVFLTFAARPLSVFAILTPFKCPVKQQLLISWAGLRGAASIVFAIMATVSPAYTKSDLFHIVFFIVLFSILLQGSLIPFAARKLKMIDNDTDVMKTFSDYSEEVPIQFLKLIITENHPWSNKKIKDIKLLPDVLLATIVRGKTSIVPTGSTVLKPNDIAVLSGPSIGKESSEGYLAELTICKDDNRLGKTLSEINFGSDKLVVLIKRDKKAIIPRGDTILKENDILIINET